MNDLITRLDEFFSTKKRNEVYAIFLIAFCAIAYFVYFFVFDISDKYYKDHLRKYNAAKEKKVELETSQNSISSNIQITEKDLSSKELNLKKIASNYDYLTNEIDSLSGAISNKDSINTFLDSLAANARLDNISVIDIVNQTKLDQNATFIDKIYDVNITFTAGFLDTLRYINRLEDTNSILDIKDVNIKNSDKYLNTNLNIIVWGIK